jgi:hypothetical protein
MVPAPARFPFRPEGHEFSEHAQVLFIAARTLRIWAHSWGRLLDCIQSFPYGPLIFNYFFRPLIGWHGS